nr:MAG TPA: hypothetical protein [Caudoviricetes sp.]
MLIPVTYALEGGLATYKVKITNTMLVTNIRTTE